MNNIELANEYDLKIKYERSLSWETKELTVTKIIIDLDDWLRTRDETEKSLKNYILIFIMKKEETQQNKNIVEFINIRTIEMESVDSMDYNVESTVNILLEVLVWQISPNNILL